MKTKASNKDGHNIQESTPIANNLQCPPMYQMKYSLDTLTKTMIKHRDKVTSEPRGTQCLHQMKYTIKYVSVSE